MTQTWEDKFRAWAKSPSATETQRAENAVGAVRNAINASAKLKARDVKVFTQGSYRNRTNVRRESDVDVGVVCYDSFFSHYPAGVDHKTFGNEPATYLYSQFKDEVGEALRSYFGAAAVTRGNKAFDVRETTYHVEADVAPFFEHQRYGTSGLNASGVELRPDSNPAERIINWPEQHYTNGNAKNDRTQRSYRALVRILKSLRNEMDENGVAAAGPIIGFLSECLIWNVPDEHFRHNTHTEDLRAALGVLYTATTSDEACQEWGEVSELKYLFRPAQKWTRQQANDFILAAWKYVGL